MDPNLLSPATSSFSKFSDLSDYEGTLVSASIAPTGVAVVATSSQLQVVPTAPVNEWSPKDVAAWVKTGGLPSVAEAFITHRISGDLLPDLTTKDLREMGITELRDRLTLKHRISELFSKQSDESLAPDAWVYKETLNLTNTLLHELSASLGKSVGALQHATQQQTTSELKRMNERILTLRDEMKRQMGVSGARVPSSMASPTTPTVHSPAQSKFDSQTPPRRPEISRQKSSLNTISTTLGMRSEAGMSSESLGVAANGAISHQTALAPSGASSRGPSVTAATTPTTVTEPLKQLRASTGDACYKILQQAMRRHRLPLEDWRKYVLVICYGDQERILNMDEKPVVVFRELREQGQHPAIMLRQVDNGQDESESSTPGGKL